MTDQREKVARAICLAHNGDTDPTPVPDELMPRAWALSHGNYIDMAAAALAAMGPAAGVRGALEKAFSDGFAISGEGWNSEYPFEQNGARPEDDEMWLARRDALLSAIEPAAPTVAEAALDPREIRIDRWGDNGPNTHVSGVKIIHEPTGLVVAVDGKGQHMNRHIATQAVIRALAGSETGER